MKRIIFLMLLIPIFFTPLSGAKSYTTQEELKKIADETQECIDKNYLTDYAMMQCTIEGTKKYNIEIEKTVKAIKDILSKTQYEQFLKSQKKWEEFTKEENEFLKQAYEKECPPYLPCLTSNSHKYHNVKNRAKNLSGFCASLTLFKKQGILDDELNFVPFKE